MRRPRTPETRVLPLVLVASLALVAGPPARAQPAAPAGGGALRLVADPARLVLGKDGGAELRIAAPAEVQELSLSTSAGRIEGLRRLPGGGFAARYRPPAERFPQVAIVAAVARTARGLADGWVAIPLSGQGTARVKARPGTQISLRIGDATFGPHPAGANGVAVIPVVVPPGVREAHHGFRPVELHVPETPLVHAVAERATVLADRSERVRALVYVVAPHGGARRGDLPVFEASRGVVSVAPREPGAFEVTWTVPPGAAGEERLVVRLAGAPASRALVRLEALAGPPAVIAVAFDREAHVAGEPLRVAVRALDAAGNPVDVALELDAEGASVGDHAEEGPGAVSARLEVPEQLGDRRELTVIARAPAVGITGSRTLPLKPGPVAGVRFSPEGAVVVADGTRETALVLSVMDQFENPVPSPPAVQAAQGEVLGVEPLRDGTFRVRYRPPAVDARTEAELIAEAEGARATAGLLLVPPRRGTALLASVGAAADARGRFAGPQVTISAEHSAGERLVLRDDLALAWRLALDAGSFGRTGARGDLRTAALLAGGAVYKDLRRGPALRASLGVGALLGMAGRAGGPDEVGVGPAARLAVGAGLPLRFGTPYIEATMLTAGRTPAGAFATFGVAAGIQLDARR